MMMAAYSDDNDNNLWDMTVIRGLISTKASELVSGLCLHNPNRFG